MEQATQDVTVLLGEAVRGDQQAVSKLIPLVYSEFRRLAGRYMNRQRANHTLQATALVHEAYLKLVQHPPAEWQNRAHFFARQSRQVMRQILVDYARGHGREKRGGGQQVVSLENVVVFLPRGHLST
jgi:RNA polymerase sigma-70 factor, ECF subfamily